MISRDQHVRMLNDFVKTAANCIETGAQGFLDYVDALGRSSSTDAFNLAVLNFGTFVLEASKPLGSENEVTEEQRKLFPGAVQAIALSRTRRDISDLPTFHA